MGFQPRLMRESCAIANDLGKGFLPAGRGRDSSVRWHEGNYSMPGILKGARVEERDR
jgi:hypothetical protein